MRKQTKKKMVRNIGKDTKKLNNGHFHRNQINARREEKRREFHLKKKKEIKKEMGALRSLLAARLWVQKWNLRTRPDQMEFAVLMNQLSLSLSLRVSAPTYLIVGRRMYWRNCSVVRHVSWWSGLPWIQAVLKSPAHVCESTKSTLNFLFYYKK